MKSNAQMSYGAIVLAGFCLFIGSVATAQAALIQEIWQPGPGGIQLGHIEFNTADGSCFQNPQCNDTDRAAGHIVDFEFTDPDTGVTWTENSSISGTIDWRIDDSTWVLTVQSTWQFGQQAITNTNPNPITYTLTLNPTFYNVVPGQGDIGLEFRPVEAGVCGNSEPDAGEQCDDGNLANGDGCDFSCQVEPGFECSAAIPGIPGMPPIPPVPSVCTEITDTLTKEVISGPDLDGNNDPDPVVEVGQPISTQYDFKVIYTNLDGPAVLIEDTVPAEWNAELMDDDGGNATAASANKRGKGKGATKIDWEPDPAGGMITVWAETRAKRRNGKFSPTACGALFLNKGAQAYEIDPATGEPKVDEFGERLPPILESNQLCLAAVSDLNGGGLVPDGSGDEDGDTLTDLAEACEIGTDPCLDDTDGDGVLDGDDACPLEAAVNDADGDGCEDPPQQCGNGILEAPEQCDDGNDIDNDGCSTSCEITVACPCIELWGGSNSTQVNFPTDYGTQLFTSGDCTTNVNWLYATTDNISNEIGIFSNAPDLTQCTASSGGGIDFDSAPTTDAAADIQACIGYVEIDTDPGPTFCTGP